ncbi:hypothetical protein [Cellulosilyticum sp. WCF-2]|uniref:hypothetical protein n=1 Tax=Cellulosilyticum sp. WCF-2 TaxID=2497860 RepID=UPI000F8D3127|nr:hypothetical protein [Cellulosilyticum sp. WCF-2]QEH70289.1 hypothetical protein EKH84_18575 [Cellulosilyticum sp. WCF-2]
MKYIVLSPDQKLIGFEDSEHVLEYCLEVDNDSLDDYCEEQELVYETMTPTEIGQIYTNIGAISGGCQIFLVSDVLNLMKENAVDEYYIEEAKALFENNKKLYKEMTCPGYIEDLLGELTPIYPSNLTEGIYFMENIDAPNDEKDNG